MSLLNCISSKLPGAVKAALEGAFSHEQIEKFISSLIEKVASQKWTVHNLEKDLEQLVSDIESAASDAGITLGDLLDDVKTAVTTVLTECIDQAV